MPVDRRQIPVTSRFGTLWQAWRGRTALPPPYTHARIGTTAERRTATASCDIGRYISIVSTNAEVTPSSRTAVPAGWRADPCDLVRSSAAAAARRSTPDHH